MEDGSKSRTSLWITGAVTFEVIGDYFGGLQSIAVDTLILPTIEKLGFKLSKIFVDLYPPLLTLLIIKGETFFLNSGDF